MLQKKKNAVNIHKWILKQTLFLVFCKKPTLKTQID